MSNKFSNRLVNETSPYLLQHAHNPVQWFAWGEEALQTAKREDKVILVSIGYSACHWCHVMEKESFENDATAALMNQHFINIKVDREERPDLDHIYMDAVQAISGSGGWPLNVFLTPDAKPFYGGTYYPPVKTFNRSSWPDVLLAIASAWTEKRNEIVLQADNLIAHLNRSGNFASTATDKIIAETGQLFTMDDCHQMFSSIMKSADKVWGGFGQAPKFPQTFTIQYLLQYQHFTNDQEAFQQALTSIDKMLQGGIYDHIGGGMARYSTDNEWLAPHFEKMLYDNALLIDVLCDAWLITKNEKYKAAILKTAAFIGEELTGSEGGFYAALDADSEGVEGKYYVWKKNEIENVLGADAPLFCEFFDVTEEGNWEKKNILRIITPMDIFAAAKNMEEKVFTDVINVCIQKLAKERNLRIKPALDDKILLGWNALALKAIAKAANILQDGQLKKVGLKNLNFLEASFKKNSTSVEMMHTYKNGIAKYPAFLDDYAFLISACFEMYQIDFDDAFLTKARKYAEFVINHFSDADNVFFFFTNQAQKDVVIRKKEMHDGAISSGNSIMAGNLYKLSKIFNIPEWEVRAIQMLTINCQATITYPTSFGVWASFLLQNATGLNELAITGKECYTIAHEISNNYIPFKIMMAANTGNDKFSLLYHKPTAIQSLIYCCKNNMCFAPFRKVNELMHHINK